MRRYGKPSAAWFKAKKWFFDQDRDLLEECHRIARLYVRQPRRTQCKICTAPLGTAADFTKHGIDYLFCRRCGHMNGAHEDTDAFCAGLYEADESDLYVRMYASEDVDAYNERRDTIYRPKADFLLDALKEQGENPQALSFADLGAGSGHLVSALRGAGVSKVRGFDVSEDQVRYANRMLGAELLQRHELDEMESVARKVECDVISIVFALEHVRRPRELLSAIAANRRARYAFIAVPMFSPCVFVEMAFPHFAHRHLTCGHTHLFTRESIDWMCREFGLNRVAEWWFGADVIDIYRMVWMTLSRSAEAAAMVKRWEETMLPVVDAMQLAIDKQHLSSEVHMLVRLPT